MAIKIDLLPGYVGLKRWFKRILIACLLVIACSAGVLYAIFYRDQLRLAKLKEDLQTVEAVAKLTEAAQSARDAAKSEADPMRSFVTFVADASRTGAERAALIDLTRQYIYWDKRRDVGALINMIDYTAAPRVSMELSLPTPNDYARFLLALRRGSVAEQGVLFSDTPQATGVPGFPEPTERFNDENMIEQVSLQPQPKVFHLSVEASGTLKNPIVVPVESGVGGPAAGGAPGVGAPGVGGPNVGGPVPGGGAPGGGAPAPAPRAGGGGGDDD